QHSFRKPRARRWSKREKQKRRNIYAASLLCVGNVRPYDFRTSIQLAPPPASSAVVALLISLLICLAVTRFVLVDVSKARIKTAVSMLVIGIMRRPEAVAASAVVPSVVYAILISVLLSCIRAIPAVSTITAIVAAVAVAAAVTCAYFAISLVIAVAESLTVIVFPITAAVVPVRASSLASINLPLLIPIAKCLTVVTIAMSPAPLRRHNRLCSRKRSAAGQ